VAECSIRVHRTETHVDDQAGLRSNWTTTIHKVVISLSNLADSPRVLTVQERMPVSSIEQVRIEPDAAHTSSAAQPDAQGIVQWRTPSPLVANRR